MPEKKYHILYVDDEADNLLAFRSVFRRYFNIHTAINGQEAIQLLKEKPFHLLLSDQRMPNMTGIELCENVMQNYPKMVRMIITGYSEMKPINEAIEKGKISKYITKPWNIHELKSEIENALTGV
ncbi:MAG: response regulator [Bacteroidota bacterium]